MSKKSLSFFVSIFILVLGLLQFATPVHALVGGVENCDNPADPLGTNCLSTSGLTQSDPRIIVARVINVSLGLLGTIATVLIVYAGFLWMTAGGNDEQAGKARKIIFASVIGLVIILSAFAISRFALGNIYWATNPEQGKIY